MPNRPQPPVSTSPGLVVLGPLAGLAAVTLLDRVRETPALLVACVGAGAALLVWTLLLLARDWRRGGGLRLERSLRPQHYVQASAQTAFLVYWGWHWPPVSDAAALIAAQILFAYAFDILLAWSRGAPYRLGFGPLPIVLSINLFLWFEDDVYALQFLLVAVALAARTSLRWRRDDRLVHVFNPAAFALTVFSLGLLVTGSSHLTRGQEIAVSQFYPPHVYLVLFLVALPGQLRFGVTTMTMSAVVVTYLFGVGYHVFTGIYYFYDSYIPIAVFLGMHLLFTDPATAPRSELGRLLFGALYGLGVIALYALLGHAGLPTFYDKLLVVPILNLCVPLLDRLARSDGLRVVDPSRLGRSLTPAGRRAAYVAVWGVVFAALSAAQGVGDRHPGQWLPFWQRACLDQRPHACRHLMRRQVAHCDTGSGWSCNEAGTLRSALFRSGGNGEPVTPAGVARLFERGCELGFAPACENLLAVLRGAGPVRSGPPSLRDYPIILQGTKGPLAATSHATLRARACAQGWPGTCDAPDGSVRVPPGPDRNGPSPRPAASPD